VTDRSVVNEVRSRTDIAELVGQYVPLRKVGARFVARCPFHEERTPSFHVSPDVGLYFCFGCKASGDALRFYEQMEGVNFPEALRVLAEKAGVQLPESRDPERIAEDKRLRDLGERLHTVCEAAAVYFEKCLLDEPFSEIARAALEDRGISPEVSAQFRLGYAPARWDGLTEHLRELKLSPSDAETAGLLLPGRSGSPYDRFRHRLMFPIFDRGGRVVAFSGRILPTSEEIPEGIVPEETGKYVNSPETPLYRKGELLFGLSLARMSIRQRERCLLVEGNFDVVQMHQHGFSETVAPLGTSFTEAQAKLLRRFTENVVLLFDGDEAGRNAARTAHAVCAKVGLIARVGVLPPKSDPDSYLRSATAGQGPEGMATILQSGESIVEWLIRDARGWGGDTVPSRLAAMRTVIPAIASVLDETERDAYVRRLAETLHIDEPSIKKALREQMQNRSAPTVPREKDADDVLQKLLLTSPINPDDTSPRSIRVASAGAVEALLVCPDLLETDEAATLVQLLDNVPALLVREARAQWLAHKHLGGFDLLEVVPDPKFKEWVGKRLIAGTADVNVRARCNATLVDSVRLLHRYRKQEYARLLKFQSARIGAQGDPESEEVILNEQLQVKRELAGVAPREGSGS